MSEEPLAPREASLEWACRSNSSDLEGLKWSDVRFDRPSATPRQLGDGHGGVRFQQRSIAFNLPPSVAESAALAQAQGQATGWEASNHVFAWPRWLVEAREHLWAPWSPVPRLLAQLVESFGVDAEIHRDEPARLARLAALLPRWHPHRGSVSRAAEVLEAAELTEQVGRVVAAVPADPEAEVTAPSETAHEVFTCRTVGWWRARSEASAEPVYRISDGYLRFQPHVGKAFSVRTDDVLIHSTPGQPVPRELLRLLPAWTAVRTVVYPEKNA